MVEAHTVYKKNKLLNCILSKPYLHWVKPTSFNILDIWTIKDLVGLFILLVLFSMLQPSAVICNQKLFFRHGKSR